MSSHFKGVSKLSLHEDVTRELVINGDLKVQKASSTDVLVRRPDRLRAHVMADDGRSYSIYYDGKVLTVYLPGPKYYAQMDVAGSIGAAMDVAESRYGVEFPAADFLRATSGEDFAGELIAAGDVGNSRVGGVDCQHYAYRTPDVDYQLWLEHGDTPLPRKLVITSKTQPAQPEYTAVMTWKPPPRMDDATFTFEPPEGATRIVFGAPAATGRKQR